MKILSYIFFLFIIFNLQGCSTKNIAYIGDIFNSKEEVLTPEEIQSNKEDEELFEEFEDETEIDEIYDPLIEYNMVMTDINDGLFTIILNPIAKGYKAVLHVEIRNSIDKFFLNLAYPTRVANNLLQGKFKNASEETGRFIINSTIGLLGFFDPATSQFGLEGHDEDFGQTLGFYGIGGGPYIVLPFFGPSNLRDSLSMIPDSMLSPIDYEDRDWFTLTDTWPEYLSVHAYKAINTTSLNLGEYEKLKKDAIDLYPFMRNIYNQYRQKQIEE